MERSLPRPSWPDYEVYKTPWGGQYIVPLDLVREAAWFGDWTRVKMDYELFDVPAHAEAVAVVVDAWHTEFALFVMHVNQVKPLIEYLEGVLNPDTVSVRVTTTFFKENFND